MAHREPGSLPWRIVSALVLAPLPIAAILLGSPWLELLTVSAAAVMAWEWSRLCRRGQFGGRGVLLLIVVVGSVAASAVADVRLAIALAGFGSGLVFAAARLGDEGAAGWTAIGVPWLALPLICCLWLARADSDGAVTLLWVLAIVWATDIGAYASGRMIGGPRLAPRWSPRKTWTGLIGGTVCAAFAGGATAVALGISPALPLMAISAGLAIVEQFGDLAESLAKRRFGVKDSSELIPGHGGLLDRLDGLLAVLPVVAVLTLIGGRSVLAWR